jgi:hypothetical protein
MIMTILVQGPPPADMQALWNGHRIGLFVIMGGDRQKERCEEEEEEEEGHQF